MIISGFFFLFVMLRVETREYKSQPGVVAHTYNPRALRRLRKEASLDYIGRLCLK
jgi:hypothetical protein